jgi:hypothetical protein
MVAALSKQLGNTAYLSLFNYSNYDTDWVTNPNIGPALSHQIACLATSSREDGGTGKVIVIAHSMGGLAIRWAATKSSNAAEVTNDLGLVITLGTPNDGSGWANAALQFLTMICTSSTLYGRTPAAPSDSFCTNWGALNGFADDSKEIKSLLWLPSNIPVYAIAGDATINVPLFFETDSVNTDSDLIVAEHSAIEGVSQTGEGGGSDVVPCIWNLPEQLFSGPNCWHSALTHNYSVEQKVISAINRYIASQAAPCSSSALFAASIAKEHFNPDDHSYKTFPPDNQAGAYGTVCDGSWALAAISRPNVGTTDGDTLFQFVAGSWKEITVVGGMPADCQLEQAGVPASVALELLPPARSFSGTPSEC